MKDLAHSSWDNCHNTEHGMNLIEMKSNTIKKTRDGSNYASIDLSDVDESDEAIWCDDHLESYLKIFDSNM